MLWRVGEADRRRRWCVPGRAGRARRSQCPRGSRGSRRRRAAPRARSDDVEGRDVHRGREVAVARACIVLQDAPPAPSPPHRVRRGNIPSQKKNVRNLHLIDPQEVLTLLASDSEMRSGCESTNGLGAGLAANAVAVMAVTLGTRGPGFDRRGLRGRERPAARGPVPDRGLPVLRGVEGTHCPALRSRGRPRPEVGVIGCRSTGNRPTTTTPSAQ